MSEYATHRGYTISYDWEKAVFEISQRGEFIEQAVTAAEAKAKIDGYFDDVK